MASSFNPRDALYFPPENQKSLEPYLPPPNHESSHRPFVTLTFATSLDSQIALSPGVQTALSGPESKAMTHFLRSRHDAILVGVGTVKADDPSLNCRLEGVGGYGGLGLQGQPRPIVIDTYGQWNFADSKVFKLAKEGKGKAPFILTGVLSMPVEKTQLLEAQGGRYIKVPLFAPPYSGLEPRMQWSVILKTLEAECGLRSLMIEGGGTVINTLLETKHHDLVDSVIITIAPIWLGNGGVVVSPSRDDRISLALPVGRLKNPAWCPLGQDVVLCGSLAGHSG